MQCEFEKFGCCGIEGRNAAACCMQFYSTLEKFDFSRSGAHVSISTSANEYCNVRITSTTHIDHNHKFSSIQPSQGEVEAGLDVIEQDNDMQEGARVGRPPHTSSPPPHYLLKTSS
eukprot:scaffold5042_cov144-Skeletonema_marinoi.AAC.4